MLIKNIQASGLLSFGPKGINLPMRKLNVLIGPNGSGKSNLLEVINLFKECVSPMRSLAGPILDAGGVEEWLWKGDWNNDDSPPPACVECIVTAPKTPGIRHQIQFYGNNAEVRLAEERIEMAVPDKGSKVPWWFYHMNRNGKPLIAYLNDSSGPKSREKYTTIPHDELTPGASILTQVRGPGKYPVFRHLEQQYSSMELYRNWSFGPHAQMRKPVRPDERQDRLARSAQNLAVVVQAMDARTKKKIIAGLQTLYPGIQGIQAKPVAGGSLLLYLEEEGGIEIPASRLSDGTLRFISLLVILHDPKPPPLIAIEEPELGLHPDVLRHVAELLMEASERTQIVVTTHSRQLVDCLGDDPESIIVCEKHDGESVFERLDGKRMKLWLEKYSLGELWSIGELGGNRW
jgi:predicted ATPase